MRALGIPVALGQDCVMDPWYSLGGADMLDVAHMAVHGAPMTSREAIRWTFDAVTEIPARILGLEDYGLAVGANADMVLLQAADPIEAVRLRATRLFVIRRGEIVARTPARETELSLAGRPARLDPASYAPAARPDSIGGRRLSFEFQARAEVRLPSRGCANSRNLLDTGPSTLCRNTSSPSGADLPCNTFASGAPGFRLGELVEGFQGLGCVHHAGARAHVDRHRHRLQHLLAAGALARGGFGVKGDAAVAAGRRDRDRERDQLLGLDVQRPGSSAARARAENAFIGSCAAPPRSGPSAG